MSKKSLKKPGVAYYRGDFDTQAKLLTQTIAAHNGAIVASGIARGMSRETASALPGQIDLSVALVRCAKRIRKFYGIRNKPAGWYK